MSSRKYFWNSNLSSLFHLRILSITLRIWFFSFLEHGCKIVIDLILQDCCVQESSQFQEMSLKFFPVYLSLSFIWKEFHPPHYQLGMCSFHPYDMVVWCCDIILQDCYIQENSQFQVMSLKFFPVCYLHFIWEFYPLLIWYMLFLSLEHGSPSI